MKAAAGKSVRDTNAGEPWVFTWSWCKRVAAFWLPGAVLFGLSQGAWHASSMNAWDEFFILGVPAAIACIVIVSGGRLLACLARRYASSDRSEVWLVLAALLAGFVMAYAAARFIGAHHQSLMQGQAGSMAAPQAVRDLRQILVAALGDAPNWVALFLAAGGYDLHAYLSERRRRREAIRATELEGLRQEKQAADLRLSVLQAQIEPHFLFNTLASVRALVTTEPERAATTIDALSDYLRSTLPRLRQEDSRTSLGQQIEICARYLELMRLRMGGRLSFSVEVSPQAAGAAFVPLLLLPLVENAITHGIEPKPGAGHIALRAQVRDGRLAVEVEDNGCGLPDKPGAGVGLANIREQLRSRFGDNATLEIRATPTGVIARIDIPAGGA
jgi:sensor histidine kinase YesM